MADIDFAARYTLTNPTLGSSRFLASTSFNDSLLVVSSSSDFSQTWYFTSTSVLDYYRLHTVAKGDQNALDVDNYYGRNSIDMHFYYVQERSGQYWQLSEQSDGSVKISNNFTGPDMFLDIDQTSLKPTLRAGDSSGTRWTLSSPGSTPTATGATRLASPSITTMSTTASRSVSSTKSSSTSVSESSAANTSSVESNEMSTGTVAGIAVGSVAAVGLLIGALVYWCCFRKNRKPGFEAVATGPGPMRSRPILNG